MAYENKNEPLRSQKFMEVMGEIPKGLVCAGYLLIAVMAAALLAVAVFVEYPYGHGETIMRHLIEMI